MDNPFSRAESEGWSDRIFTGADETAVVNGCYWDQKAGDRVVKFIETFLYQTKNVDTPKPVKLADWQREEIILPLFCWKNKDGLRRFRQAYIEIPKKNGKALDLNTPIPTPDGWKTMGDIEPGDKVFDENGLPINVVAVSEVMTGRPVYKVTFSDGYSIVADAKHEWKTKTRKPENKVSIWTTEEIASTLRIDSPGSAGSNHSIPVAAALALAAASLPIEPYTLGVWLGDGTSSTGEFTFSDKDSEIVENLIAAGTKVRVRSNSSGNSIGLLNPRLSQKAGENDCFRIQARKLGVLNNKHIPQPYLRASYSQRLALLQGLMDTDGTCSKAGQCSFTTISERLRDDVLELIQTLGLKATYRTKDSWIGEKYCGVVYEIQFHAFIDTPVFRLTRKRNRQKQKPNKVARSTNRHIVSCELVDSVPVKCIEVDSPSHLFLAGKNFVPTHNSFLASAIVLYLLLADGENRAEVYSIAYDKENAKTVYDECRINAEGSPDLEPLLSPIPSRKRIDFTATNSFYQVLAADQGQRNEGFDISGLVIDELHTLRKPELFEALRWGGKTRRQPLSVYITTAGSDRNTICYELHEHAQAILDGNKRDVIDFFPYIRSAEGLDWTTEEAWKKANPMLGLTIPLEVFRADFIEAQSMPNRENAFKRYNLNIWTDKKTTWLGSSFWHNCGKELFNVDELEGCNCTIGVDLGMTDDLAAAVLAFKHKDGFKVIPYFWISEENAKKKNKFNPYLRWKQDGFIKICGKEATDFDIIKQDLIALSQKFEVETLAIDPFQATYLGQQLAAELINVQKYGQNFKYMTEPCRLLETLVLEGKLWHNNHPVLSWQANNATLITDNTGSMRINKPKKGSPDKVDGMVALLMAIGVTMAVDENKTWIETL